MRNSFDGLSGLIQNNFGGKPRSGDVFIFINKGRNKIKLLHWQGAFFTFYYKRLESRQIELLEYQDVEDIISINYAQIVMIVDGLSIKNIQPKTSCILMKQLD